MANFWNNLKNVFYSMTEWHFVVTCVLFVALFTVAYYLLFSFLKSNGSKGIIIFFTISLIVSAVVFVLWDIFATRIFIAVPVIFIFAIVLLYSTEIKRKLRLGEKKFETKTSRKNYDEEEVKNCINSIITALQNMSKKDIGALIVLSNNNVPTQVLDSGIKIDADISSELIESVFFPKSPLHDGAMIINGTKITATGCFLPLSQNENIPKELGTRHRAGIGITETIDVTVLVVSEETGVISIIKGGKITRYADTVMLKNVLSKFYWQELINDK